MEEGTVKKSENNFNYSQLFEVNMSKPHGNYALDPKPIGSGGQAEVFRARNKKTGEYVALKRLLSELRYDQDAIARMKREIDVQTKVCHPNIMPILDHSSNDYWYTMPIAEKTLRDLPLPINLMLILQVIEDVAQGLLVAHQSGNIHRDVTPNNILLLNHGDFGSRWVISDWGLVRRIGQTSVVRTHSGYSYGTAGFAAPEMAQNAHEVDESVDVYSLGQIVGWGLTGNWPIQNIPLCPDGPMYEFILKTTKLYPSDRVKNMKEVLQLIKEIKEQYNRHWLAM